MYSLLQEQNQRIWILTQQVQSLMQSQTDLTQRNAFDDSRNNFGLDQQNMWLPSELQQRVESMFEDMQDVESMLTLPNRPDLDPDTQQNQNITIKQTIAWSTRINGSETAYNFELSGDELRGFVRSDDQRQIDELELYLREQVKATVIITTATTIEFESSWEQTSTILDYFGIIR